MKVEKMSANKKEATQFVIFDGVDCWWNSAHKDWCNIVTSAAIPLGMIKTNAKKEFEKVEELERVQNIDSNLELITLEEYRDIETCLRALTGKYAKSERHFILKQDAHGNNKPLTFAEFLDDCITDWRDGGSIERMEHKMENLIKVIANLSHSLIFNRESPPDLRKVFKPHGEFYYCSEIEYRLVKARVLVKTCGWSKQKGLTVTALNL